MAFITCVLQGSGSMIVSLETVVVVYMEMVTCMSGSSPVTYPMVMGSVFMPALVNMVRKILL